MRSLPEHFQRTRLLVDGYNVLFGMGWMAQGDTSHRALERARSQLASRLAERTPSAKREQVLVVFDALDAPKHLPVESRMHGLSIHYSRDWLSADEMLCELIAKHSSPKKLVVLSSDHAVQRKASARGAQYFDCEQWESAIDAFSGEPQEHQANDQARDPDSETLSKEERKEWMRRFGFPD